MGNILFHLEYFHLSAANHGMISPISLDSPETEYLKSVVFTSEINGYIKPTWRFSQANEMAWIYEKKGKKYSSGLAKGYFLKLNADRPLFQLLLKEPTKIIL